MNSLNITTVSFSLHRNGLKFSTEEIEEAFKLTFDYTYLITICNDEIEVVDLETERVKRLTEYHESLCGGHQGTARLYARIRADFYWKGMRQDIINFVKTCESCQRYKLDRNKTRQPMLITDTPKRPFEKIQMDIVGPLPITENGNRYLLTIQDNFSKFSDAIPLESTDAIQVALAFATNFISKHGCPNEIHTDQGRNFMSNLFAALCKIFKIKQLKSTAYHPESLGSLERAHHVFIEYLKHYCQKNDWDSYIPYCIFFYKTAVNSSTNFTPFRLVYGREAVIPSEFANEKVPETFNKYLDNLFSRLTYTQSQARQNLENAKNRCKYYYDRHLNPRVFNRTDLVYFYKDAKNSKFDPHWAGPYEVARVFNDLNVEIKTKGTKTKIVHANKLRLACVRPDCLPEPHLV